MDTRYDRLPHRRLSVILGGLLALGTVVLALVIFGLSRGATAASDTEPQVDVSADSLQISPGDTLSIKVRITNPLTSTLSKIVVKLDYDSGQLTPIDSDFHRDSDWVSGLSDSRVTLTFKNIGAGKSRSGTIQFHVNRPDPGNTSVEVHAKFNWYVNDSAGQPIMQGSGSDSGSEPLIVAPDGVLTNPNVIASAPQAAIEPASGAPGSLFRAHASGFQRGERISIWLNTPNGVAAVPHDLAANDNGEVWPEFSSNDLAPGNYGLVIYGQESTQTLVVPFTVSASAVPPAAAVVPALAVVPPPAALSSANIEPQSAAAGTEFRAHASGFQRGERISIWLNTPNGVAAVPHDLAANDNGEVWPEFSSNDLAPGDYGLVIYGQESAQTLVVPFTVSTSAVSEPPAAAPALAVPPPPALGVSPALALWAAAVPLAAAPAPPPANIEPQSAAAGTHFRAYARGLQGGENISIWLNTSGGVKGLDGSFSANSVGEVRPEFSSDGLAPGSYGLVIYGRTSGLTVVVPFVITS